MDTTTISREQKAAIDKLIASPMGREALERAERDRAVRRSEILKRMKDEKAEAISECITTGGAAKEQRAIVAERRQALLEAECALIGLESASSAASFRADRVQNRAWWELESLGTEAIERARQVVRRAEHEARNAMTFRLQPTSSHWLRGPSDPVLSDRDRSLNRHVDRMLEIISELEAMLFDEMLSPQQIEARCQSICEEAKLPDAYVPLESSEYAVPSSSGSTVRPRKSKA